MNGSGFGSLMGGLSGGYNAVNAFKAKKPEPEMTPEAAKSAEAGSTGAAAAAPKAESTAWSTLSGIVDSVSGMFKSKPALASGISQPATVGTEVAGLEGGL